MAKDKSEEKAVEKKEESPKEELSFGEKVKSKLDDIADQLKVPQEPKLSVGLVEGKEGEQKEEEKPAALEGAEAKVAEQDGNHIGDGQPSHTSDPARDTADAILAEQKAVGDAAGKVIEAAKMDIAPIAADETQDEGKKEESSKKSEEKKK